jgi:magnesium transporter
MDPTTTPAAPSEGTAAPDPDATSGQAGPPGLATPPTTPPAGSGDVPQIRIVVHRSSGLTESTDITELPKLHDDADACLWIDLIDPDAELVRKVSRELDLHPLIPENIIERNQRAKIETFGAIVHVVLFSLRYAGEAEATEIDFVLGEGFLLSVHGPACDLRGAAALRSNAPSVMGRGSDYLFYSLVDHVVDGYFPVLDALAEEIDDLQDRVVASADEWTLQRLFTLKRELIAIRRATSPAREIFNQLTNREVGPIAEAHVVYFRDVYDHLIRVTDELDNYRELVSGTLDIYLTIVNNNLSIIMKRLTGVTVILAGIGAIAGIFGMSEAGSAFSGAEATGFWIVSGVSVAIAVVAAVVLRRIDWI